jgi:heterodisulfide reductase subunit C
MSKHLEKRWDSDATNCYQCGKCSAGCQMAPFMDILPHQVIRLVQVDQVDKVLSSTSIWYCAGCQTCYSRCPQEVNLPHLMDLLCEKSVEAKKVHPKARKLMAFHKSFLNGVQMFGRSFELTLVAELKMRTLNLFQDLWNAVLMLVKGKLSFFPSRKKNMTKVRALFKKD